jgi:hypothetical protein
MTEGTRSGAIPPWAVAVDVLAAAALATGVWIIFTGGLDRTEILGVRVSANQQQRPVLLGLILLAVRHFFVPRHPVLVRCARALVRFTDTDERKLFGSWNFNAFAEFGLVTLGFMTLVAAVTWPQVRDVYGVPDAGDPLFSVWRIAWIAHQLRRDPANLFNGNIFHPEALTLTYSDSILVPGLAAAPFVWLGLPVIPVYTFLFLSAWVFSGVTTYYLVRALTGRRDAAAIAGVIFAIYPYRFEHYPHLEQQMTLWAPLTLLMLHRAIAGGRLRHGLATGFAYALQMYSCMYVALFLAAYMLPLGATLWFGRGRPRTSVRSLAFGALLAGVLVAPLAAAYLANKPMFGERSLDAIQFYSAMPADYLEPHFRSRLYGAWHEGGQTERQLFPGVAALVLAAIGFRPPLSATRLGYALAGLLAFDASLGLNGLTYPLLHDLVAPYRGLRVPARFSILLGLTLAVGAGYAAASLLSRWAAARRPLTVLLLTLAIVDAWPRLELTSIDPAPPAIYHAIPAEPPSVLAEFPVGADAVNLLSFQYIYFSTFHWHRLLDGNSGFFPPSWFEYAERTARFPNDESLSYLRSRGVQYFAVHAALYDDRDRAREIQQQLAARSDVERIATAPFRGATSALYRFR